MMKTATEAKNNTIEREGNMLTIGNTFEVHQSATYRNAVKFAIKMAKRQPEAPVDIHWVRHNQDFRETFIWSDEMNDIIPYYGG